MKKITSVFLSVVMLISLLSMTAMAAGTTDCLRASAAYDRDAGTVALTFVANKATTNGRFTVAFDNERLSFKSAETGVSAIVVDALDAEGTVAVGYALSSVNAIAAGKTVIVLEFEVIGSWYLTSIDVTVAEFNDQESLNASLDPITVFLIDGAGNSDPTPPPVNPNPPVDPNPPADDPEDNEDEDKDEGKKPGIELEIPELTEERYNSIVTQYPDAEDHWAEENIVKAVNAGLFNGTGENTFDPNGVVTRGMFVTLLYRMCGEPAVTGSMPFTDVPANQYYADAVKWAYANNVVGGITATEFAPNQEMTREQMVTMLYRYAKHFGADTTKSTGLSAFADAAKVSSWAKDAMSWAVAEGIITGSYGNLSPADHSTRAQIATVLVRYAGL